MHGKSEVIVGSSGRWTLALVAAAVAFAAAAGIGLAQDGTDKPPPKPDPVVTTPQDKDILKRTKNKKLVYEAQTWSRERIHPHQDIDMLTVDAYGAGAVQVWADMEGQQRFRPSKLYVELPADPEKRKAVIAKAAESCTNYQFPAPEPVKDDKQVYLVVKLAGSYKKPEKQQ